MKWYYAEIDVNNAYYPSSMKFSSNEEAIHHYKSVYGEKLLLVYHEGDKHGDNFVIIFERTR